MQEGWYESGRFMKQEGKARRGKLFQAIRVVNETERWLNVECA